MKAFYLNKSRKLEYGEFLMPKPKKGEALIKVKACALNHLDLHLAKSVYEIPLPHILGSDVSGLVEEINGKSKLQVGDEILVNPAIPCGVCPRCKKGLSCEIVIIFGYKTPGGYAEYVTVPIEQLYPKPKNFSFIEAAAFPLTFLTAYHMLVGRANLQKGEIVFVWGASGGLGSAAIQIAKNLGAKIIAAAGTDEDAKKIKAMGTNHVINYRNQNVEHAIKKLTNNEKVDVVFESIGAKTWNTSLAIVKPQGRVVIAGTTSGALASQDLSDVYYYQQTILGCRMGTKEEFGHVLKLAETGKLKPIIDTVFPLKDADKALKRLEESKQMGKIVLEI
ncbi:zinc-binding dehydrogenase [Candidatus Gottesmanbacteria bacterium]|nr:zinc-binding dehydrogenase [Candidatus Gottesmanbacteria bacterium]